MARSIIISSGTTLRPKNTTRILPNAHDSLVAFNPARFVVLYMRVEPEIRKRGIKSLTEQ